MLGYMHSSGVMELGTLASGSVIFALNNTSATKNLIIKRLKAVLGFSGTPAATRIRFGVCRATGTAAAGTGNASGATVGKRQPGIPNSIASVYWGPTAITGLSPDAVGDFKQTYLNHQVGSPTWDEIINDDQRQDMNDPIIIAPGTSLIVITRDISVAGSGIGIDAEWNETI